MCWEIVISIKYVIVLNKMITVTRKHQINLTLIAVVLTTAVISGTFAIENNAFAFQSISQSCETNSQPGLDSFTEQGTSKGFQTLSFLTNTPDSQSDQSDHCLNTNNADNSISNDISLQD
jgi:hypothetical protein